MMGDCKFTVEYTAYPDNTPTNSNPFTFNPKPRSIQKTFKYEWRHRHIGRRRQAKARPRKRYHEAYKIEGSMDEDLRLRWEHYAGKPSAFKFVCDMTSAQFGGGIGDTEDVYVIIDNSDFRMIENKKNSIGQQMYDYMITLKRVTAPS
jgi:hypothetical protein